MFLKIFIALIILIFFHFLIKNYLLTHNRNYSINDENTSNSKIDYVSQEMLNLIPNSESEAPIDNINHNINSDYQVKINNQYNKQSENPTMVQNTIQKDAKNNLLDFINNSI